MINNFNKKAQYPFTYGDKNADEVRLSDYVVELMKTKRFQSHVTAIFFALLTLGSYSQPSRAIPPEYGEAAANVAQGVGQDVPPLGDVVGNVNVNRQPPIPNNGGQVGQAGRVNLNPGPNINQPNFGQNGMPQKPIQPAWRLPGPPTSPAGQYANTIFLIGSVGWICLNASWGNPLFAYGCVGVVGGLINELRKRCL